MSHKLLPGGRGQKRPRLYVEVQRLELDPYNPRLPEEHQGEDQPGLEEVLRNDFYLEELALSMAQNGYFDEEPLVAIPKELPEEFHDLTYKQLANNDRYLSFLKSANTKFIIVEGNRRLCTVRLLLSNAFKSIRIESDEVRSDFEKLPIIIYPTREEVLTYLGVRHVIGVKKWDAYAKARYVARMVREHDFNLELVQRLIGDRGISIRKTYAAYRIIELVSENYTDFIKENATEAFSYLQLSLGQAVIRQHLGLPTSWKDVNSKDPISPQDLDKAKELLTFLYGDKNKQKVVRDSREITNKLTHVLKSEVALSVLRKDWDLDRAFHRSEGEMVQFNTLMRDAKYNLEEALTLAGKPQIKLEYNHSDIEDIKSLLKSIQLILESN